MSMIILPAVPAAFAAGCSSSGFGDESCSVTWNCPTGGTAYVSANVDDSGSIHGDVACQNEGSNHCDGFGTCVATVGASGGAGTCGGYGNGGFWTSLSITCGPGSGFAVQEKQGDSSGAFSALARAVILDGGVDSDIETLLMPSQGSATHILGYEGIVAAYVCSAGLGCNPTPLTCTLTLDRWRCAVSN